ncbi:MAG: bacteriohemerythrin [Pseudomonadota bacterium]
MPIYWTNDLDTGIEVIDNQHRRLVEYINQLEAAKRSNDIHIVRQVVDDCVDYTISHFAFEESLQEEAGYPYCKPHKRVHDLFTKRVESYQERLILGDNVADELHDLLGRWLITHIKRDDADYVQSVKANMIGAASKREAQEGSGWLRRFFRRS